MRFSFSGLWRHADFLKLWSGQTISVFGSMIGGTAMSFTAILFLQATPFQLGVLNAMQLIPAFLTGLFAGAWVDRLRRRPIMIFSDLGRAMVLGSIPLAAVLGVLHIEQLFLVALVVSILSIFFDVAYQSYLPTLVGKDDILEGNSKLSASAAVAEFGGFTIAGWLVQALTGPITILIDAASFLVSAVTLGMIRAQEPPIEPADNPNLRREIREGLQTVWKNSLLRASAAGVLLRDLGGGIFGALVVLYMSKGLGFEPGILGMIWAVGGVSSFLGAALAPRMMKRLGIGPTMITGMAIFGFTSLLIPLASGATLLSAILLICAQLGDGFYIAYEINHVSLRQAITDERMLGRVNATMRFLAVGATLLGSLVGGGLGEMVGVRPMLIIGAILTMLGALSMALSPLRRLMDVPENRESESQFVN